MKSKVKIFLLFSLTLLALLPECTSKQKQFASVPKPSILVTKKEHKPDSCTNISYPIVSGFSDSEIQDQVNQKLKDLFMVHENQKVVEEEEVTNSLEYNFSYTLNKNLLTIEQTGYFYEGGAHGLPSKQVLYIDTRTGLFYNLRDLVHSDEDMENFRELLRLKFDENKDNYSYLVDEVPPITSETNFYLRPEGIEIFFYPYEIACFADGFPSFLLSWQELEGMIDKDKLFS